MREHIGDHRVRLPAMRLRETSAVVDEPRQVPVHSIRAAPVDLSMRDRGGEGDRGGTEGDHLDVLASGRDLAVSVDIESLF